MGSAALNIAENSQPELGNIFPARHNSNFSAENRKGLPEAFSISQMDLTERCRRVMVADVGNDPGAVKRLARKLGCSIGTAKNYLEGRTTPRDVYDARAIAVIPGYYKMKMELAGRAMELDPSYQARLVAFVRDTMLAGDKIFGGNDGR